MPSEAKLERGRPRSKTRPLRGARSRLVACEAGYMENPAIGSNPGSSNFGRVDIMAATPPPHWQASLRGLRAENGHSLVKICTHKRIGLLMLSIWILLLLCYYLSPGFANTVSTDEYVQNADGQTLEKLSAWESLLRFFFPTTCMLKDNQEVKPCNKLQHLNETECLRYKCCFSLVKPSDIRCFLPLRDKPTQMFRMFGLGVISMVFLGCLPLYCCSLCRRSKWANPLRRKVHRMLKGFKKQRNKPRKDDEVLGTAMEDEEDDEKDQETKGN
ncbi:fragile X mental retardation 1 neighbor protein [Otolemur garnettii]|uniref:fragile X mental retardation 1 neighbor protein n=1 Tax=Otolemur garnettii TaxID=30611 RepID=UPI000C7EE0AC|nr:fragile X mental retardation 1 neighbor protein [Otolemur garnettii]